MRESDARVSVGVVERERNARVLVGVVERERARRRSGSEKDRE